MESRFKKFVEQVEQDGFSPAYAGMTAEELVALLQSQGGMPCAQLTQHLMAVFAPEIAKAVCKKGVRDEEALMDGFDFCCTKLMDVLASYDSQKGDVKAYIYVSMLRIGDAEDGRLSHCKECDVAKVKKIISSYEMTKGRQPSRDEILKETGFGELRLFTTLDYIYMKTIYIEQISDDGEGNELEVQIANQQQDDPQELFISRCMQDELKDALDGLAEADRELILESILDRKNQKEIAVKYKKSQQWVSKRLNIICETLRRYLISKGGSRQLPDII